MKKLLITILVIALIASVSICFFLKTQIDTAKNDILDLTSTVNSQEVKMAETEAELDLTNGRLKETEAELTVLYNERDTALELNEELDKELFEVQQELNNVEKNLLTQIARVSDVQAELEALQEELQLYYDTGIMVAQGVVPPYRKRPDGTYDLENNPSAINISWSQLKNFLRADRTDNKPYIENYYMCGEFAETLHNNAENSGIKAAWVVIQFEDQSTAHALNAFVTVDRGLVYIDATGTEPGTDRPLHLDCVVTIEVGQRLYFDPIFTSDWEISPSRSKVSQVEIYW